jgi:hypothetical protein
MKELRINNLTPPEFVRKYFIFENQGSLIHDYCYRLGIPFCFDSSSNLCEIELTCGANVDLKQLEAIDWSYFADNTDKILFITYRTIQTLSAEIIQILNRNITKHSLEGRVYWFTQNPLDRLVKDRKFNLAFFDSLSNVICESSALVLEDIRKEKVSWNDLACDNHSQLFMPSSKSLDTADKHFSFFAHRPTAPRLFAYYNLHKRNLLDKGNYSFHSTFQQGKKNVKDYLYEDLHNHSNHFSKLGYDINTIITYKDKTAFYDNTDGRMAEFCHMEECHRSWASGLVQYVSETSAVADNEIFISEKIFANYALGRPFLLNGNRGTLRYLKSYYGFKSFDLLFDESYDMMDNYVERVHYSMNELEKFCSLPFETAKAKVEEIQDVLVHNKKVFNSIPHAENFRRIFNV